MSIDKIRPIDEIIGSELNNAETKLWLEEGKIKVGDIIEFKSRGKIIKERVAIVVLNDSIYKTPGVVVELMDIDNGPYLRKYYINYDQIIVKIKIKRSFNGNKRKLNLY